MKRRYDIEKVTGILWRKKKSYRYLYRMALEKEVIRKAFYRMKRGRSDREDIKTIMENLDLWVSRMQTVLYNTKPEGIHVEHSEYAFCPTQHRPIIIRDNGKTRVIYVPDTMELWIQHIIVLILEPIIAGSSYSHSYSSFPGRGGLRGKKTLARWIRLGKGIRNFAQCDIRHFYQHIQYRLVRERLKRRVHDEYFLHLIDVCMTWFPKGLPLGFYLSQWLANFFLQELDYEIKTRLKIAHYIRYMDNLTMADDNKKKLHAAIHFIRQWLGKRRLKMKNDWQVFRFDYTKKNGRKTGRGVSAMGWVFFRNKTILRKNILLHARRLSDKIHKKCAEKKAVPISWCRGFVSLLGWITHSGSYEWYLMYIKPIITVKMIKRIISKTDRRERKDAAMEGRITFNATGKINCA